LKVRERLDDLRYLEEDWRFYVIAFIPFFLAAFAVWIFAFEGLFARIFSIAAIIWAWLPTYPWTALRYHWLGIVLLGISIGWIIIHIVVIERSPVRRRKIPILKGVDRWRNWLRNPIALVALGLLMIVLVFIGAIQMILAFNASDYFPHWWGRTFVFSALIVGFVLIVSERGFDREKVDARSKKRLSYYKEYIPEDVIEQKVRYLRTLSPVEREKRIQETIQRYVQAEKREPPT
jgi:hypothetical protein